MLSRVADSLYWMSRYLERAEHTARVVEVNLNLTLDRAPRRRGRHWGRLLGQPARSAAERPRSRLHARAIHSLDLANRESIAACVARGARERAPGARADQLRDVGADQPAVPRRCSDASPTRDGRTHTHECLTVRHRGRAPVPGRHRRHDDARRRLALHPSSAASSSAPSATAALLDGALRGVPSDDPDQPDREWSDYVEWVGLLKSAARSRRYCRHYTADLRPTRDRGVPAPQRRLPAVDPLRRRPGRVGAQGHRAAHGPRQRARRAAGRPAARVARLRAGGRDHEPADFARVPRATSSGSAPTSTPRCTRPTSRTRSRRACHPDGTDALHHHAYVTRFVYQAPISESVMEVRMQPRNEGSQRCQRFELHTTPRARVLRVPGRIGKRRPPLQHPGPARELHRHGALTVEMLAGAVAPRGPAGHGVGRPSTRSTTRVSTGTSVMPEPSCRSPRRCSRDSTATLGRRSHVSIR